MSETNPIDTMFDALAAGDVAAGRASCTPDARIWHNFDGIAHDLDDMERNWGGLIAATETRGIADVRRQATAEGFVQQHLFHLTPKGGGERKVWAVCIVVRIEDGRIARLDEYIDRSGALASDGQPLTTPGF